MRLQSMMVSAHLKLAKFTVTKSGKNGSGGREVSLRFMPSKRGQPASLSAPTEHLPSPPRDVTLAERSSAVQRANDYQAFARPGSAERPGQGDAVHVTVVVCAYADRRWTLTCAAVKSALRQAPPPAEVLLVIDHNPPLAARARQDMPGITVLESDGPPGLSGARNVGLRAATQPITVFLDDDAEACPGWLESLTEPYQDADVVATGGHVRPRWPQRRPAWFPSTFDWVVGCSYLGLPDHTAPIRNPIGANMSMRTSPAITVGGFDTSVGRVRGKPSGCEETELAIRLTASRPGTSILYVPGAVVDHEVAPERIRLRYFIRRCWNEGRSKAIVVQLAGAGPGLERERRQVAAVIPAALRSDLRRLGSGDLAALARIAAAIAGLAAATVGYLAGRAVSPARDRAADVGPTIVKRDL
jgi:hypothetical protein